MTQQTRIATLNNGVEMPMLGLGVFQSPPEETTAAVAAAIADGYRLIDTAAAYGNEREVGEAIRASGVDRGELFVTTKLWYSDYGYDEAFVGFEGCLRRLGVDYVDLFLLHQPVPTDFDGTVGAYKAMEKMLSEGRTRAIGVSNFSEQHLENLMRQTEVVPAINQVELHPFFTQQPLREFHAKHGITTEAWSPLGGIHVYRPADPNAVLNALEHPTVTAIAEKHGKTPAQVVLRWHIETRGRCNPEVGEAAPDQGELRRLRLRADGRRGRLDRRARHRRPRGAGSGDAQHDDLPEEGRELKLARTGDGAAVLPGRSKGDWHREAPGFFDEKRPVAAVGLVNRDPFAEPASVRCECATDAGLDQLDDSLGSELQDQRVRRGLE